MAYAGLRLLLLLLAEDTFLVLLVLGLFFAEPALDCIKRCWYA